MKQKTTLYISILALIVLGVLLGGRDAHNAVAQEQAGWLPATSLPVGMGGGLAYCPDMPGSFYLVSGIEGAMITTDRLLRYDISAATWVELASMPKPVRLGAVTCYQGKIYLAGGWDGGVKNTFYIYDIAQGTWSKGPKLPDPVWGAGLGAWEGKLYLVGGSNASVAEVVSRVDVYDIVSETWTEGGGAEMPIAAGFFARAQVGSYLYIVGGYSSAFPVNSDQTQRYNMSTDTWEVGPSFTSLRALGTLAITSSHLYMLGGDLNEGGLGEPTDLVEVLDLTAWPGGTWMDLGDPLPAVNISPATTCTEILSDGEIWDVGGMDMVSGGLSEVYYRLMEEPCTAAAYGVSVTPESDEKLGSTGETIDFTLTVTNTGAMEDTFDITLSNLWVTVAPLTTGLLEPDEAVDVTVSVTIPSDALPGEQDTVEVTFTSQGDPEVTATATLTTRNFWYGLSVTPESAEQTGLPGGILTYTITVTNTGEAGDMFSIVVDGNLWDTSAPATTIWLESYVSEEVQVVVSIPLDALPGSVDVAVLTFTSQHDPESTDTVTLTSRVPFLYNYLPIVMRWPLP
jgi:hypothetical protein